MRAHAITPKAIPGAVSVVALARHELCGGSPVRSALKRRAKRVRHRGQDPRRPLPHRTGRVAEQRHGKRHPLTWREDLEYLESREANERIAVVGSAARSLERRRPAIAREPSERGRAHDRRFGRVTEHACQRIGGAGRASIIRGERPGEPLEPTRRAPEALAQHAIGRLRIPLTMAAGARVRHAEGD